MGSRAQARGPVQDSPALIQDTREKYGTLESASLDKGFQSPENQADLQKIAELVVMPKKGKLASEDIERETDPEFVRLRRKHSAVESAINALECHGFGRCPDHGIDGFSRYVALAVLRATCCDRCMGANRE
jgi:hypothetical protein